LSFFHELKRRNVFRVAVAYIVAAWLIIQVAETIFPLYGLGTTPARITVTLLAIGFPLFLLLAWVFEITPDGLVRESEVDHNKSVTRKTSRKLDRLIITLLVVALGYFAFDKFVLDPGRDAKIAEAAEQAGAQKALMDATKPSISNHSIAVLPFINMSDDSSNEYFSDGLSEELLNLLAKVRQLQVAARTSSFSMKGKNLHISDIGEILKVAHVLEGSVRKEGNQVRITAQLIHADDGYHLWSETYDRSLDDIFAIQDEIANEVVQKLKISILGEAPKVRQTNPQAYALFLQGRHILNSGNREQSDQALALLEQVVKIDPEYAEAWSELGRSRIIQAWYGLMPEKVAYELGRDAQNRALKIDPTNASALSRLGWLEKSEGNLDQSAKHFQLALELEPGNSAVLGNAAQFLEEIGRLDQAIRLATRFIALNPASAGAHLNLARSLYMSGARSESLHSAQTAANLSPEIWETNYVQGNLFLLRQDYEAAYAAFEQEGDPTYRARGVTMATFSLGQRVEFEKLLDTLKQNFGEKRPSDIAAVYIYIGDFDSAFTWLEKAVQSGDTQLPYQLIDPLLAGIRKDERWSPFLERIGRSPQQLDAIEFMVSLPD
jgi:TolB-like protein/Flp pilus assembly protein TadD